MTEEEWFYYKCRQNGTGRYTWVYARNISNAKEIAAHRLGTPSGRNISVVLVSADKSLDIGGKR